MINIRAIPQCQAQYQPASGGSIAAPSLVTDGADITSWAQGYANGKIVYDAATVYLQGAGTGTLTGPVNVWGYRDVDKGNAQSIVGWYLVGTLDGGGNISITGASQGSARRVDEVGIFKRLAISCAAVTSQQYTVTFEPIAVLNG